jgi:N-acetylneuraminic acid mutarotase
MYLSPRIILFGLLGVLLFGSAILSDTHVHAQTDNPWGMRAPLLQANSEMAVAELNGEIYVLGGYPSSRVTTDTVQIYDPIEDSWNFRPPMPQKLNHLSVISFDGNLYAIGGQTSASGGGPFVSNVYEYDPVAVAWTEKAAMPTARSGTAAAAVGEKIYVAGGRPPRGYDFAVYDPFEDAWTTLPDLPTDRNHLSVTAIDGEIYVVGGRFGSGFSSEVTDIVEIYNPSLNTWRTGTPMPTKRSGHNAILADGCLHVFGGEGNGARNINGLYPQHEVYNPVSDTWISLDPMPIAVHGVTGLAYINGLIHLPGGGTSQGGSSGSTIHQVYRTSMSCE